jgi:hypothetical protein
MHETQAHQRCFALPAFLWLALAFSGLAFEPPLRPSSLSTLTIVLGGSGRALGGSSLRSHLGGCALKIQQGGYHG